MLNNKSDFILAYYQRALARMIANQNLTFCSDLEMVIELINKFPVPLNLSLVTEL